MADLIADAVFDAALDEIVTADQVVCCIGQPSTYADATTDSGSGGNACGETAVTGSDFTTADGDTSGRKTTFGGKSSIAADVAGDWDHIAFVDDGASRLLAVFALDSTVAVTTDGTMSIPSFDFEIRDPS